jgi:hypothetical protein
MVGRRGIGYCQNIDCEDYCKGFFMINNAGTFYCARCRERGLGVFDEWWKEGDQDVYKKCVVEFNYDPSERCYREMAIVEDQEIDVGSTVKYQSALIRTERRALKVAESILCRLAIDPDAPADDFKEVLLDYSLPMDLWKKKLAHLEKKWTESPRHKFRTIQDRKRYY